MEILYSVQHGKMREYKARRLDKKRRREKIQGKENRNEMTKIILKKAEGKKTADREKRGIKRGKPKK